MVGNRQACCGAGGLTHHHGLSHCSPTVLLIPEATRVMLKAGPCLLLPPYPHIPKSGVTPSWFPTHTPQLFPPEKKHFMIFFFFFGDRISVELAVFELTEIHLLQGYTTTPVCTS
jgi:hypothetical protein